jgi:hypothetical protein
MHRMRTGSASSSFKLSIKRTLAALYKRRAEIEDLIACLDSQTHWTNNGGQLMDTRPQLQTRRKKSPCFRQPSNNPFQTHVKTPQLM